MADDLLPLETPWRRDHTELASQLGAWAKHAVGRGAEVGDVESPDANGASSETVLFSMRLDPSAEPVRYAARLAPLPSAHPVFPEYDIDAQRRCMELVGTKTIVPVPDVSWCVLDESWLGTAFLVMPCIEGVAAPDLPPYTFDGWLLAVSPEARARMQENAVRVLAGVHEVTAEGTDLSFLTRPVYGPSPLGQQLGYQRWYYEWAKDDLRFPLIERTFQWLEANLPEEGPAVLNWGDARIGNILWRGTEPSAALDWEMAAVGPREVDVAWLTFFHAFFQDLAAAFGLPGLPDFLDRAEVVRAYERFSGHRLQDMDWYEVFAALRFAIICVRLTIRTIAYGLAEKPADPDDLIVFRALLERMIADDRPG